MNAEHGSFLHVYLFLESDKLWPLLIFQRNDTQSPLQIFPASCSVLSSGLGCGTDRAHTAQLSAILEMVERAGELTFGGSRRLNSDFVDMAVFERGFEKWGGF